MADEKKEDSKKINIQERLDAIQYKFPTAKERIAATKSTRGPSSRVGKLAGLQGLQGKLGKQFSKSDYTDLFN